jgi:hypothetical protein
MSRGPRLSKPIEWSANMPQAMRPPSGVTPMRRAAMGSGASLLACLGTLGLASVARAECPYGQPLLGRPLPHGGHDERFATEKHDLCRSRHSQVGL